MMAYLRGFGKQLLQLAVISFLLFTSNQSFAQNASCYGPYNPTPAAVWGIAEKFQSNAVIWNGATPTAADLNGDNISELLVTANDYSGYYVYQGNGSNATTATKNYVIATTSARSIQPAVANIIGAASSAPEVVMVNATGFVYIFNNVGGTETSYLYKSTTASQYASDVTPYIVDIDEDGTAEIVLGSDIFGIVGGALVKRVAGTPLNYIGATSGATGTAIDVVVLDIIASNPGKELVYGSRVYSVNLTAGTMAVLKDLSTIAGSGAAAGDNGPTAVADMDLDGDLDIVYNGSANVYIWDPNQSIVLFKRIPPAFSYGVRGLPLIANVYNEKVNNGKANDYPEAVIINSTGSAGIVTAYNLNFTTATGSANQYIWSLATNDLSGCTGITAFDFDGNGIREIVYRDQSTLRIINGNLALPVNSASFAAASSTWGEYPIVGDFDNDNEADIAVSADGKLRVFNRAVNTFAWKDAPNYWNQRNYRIVNINSNLTVPTTESNPASSASINNNVAQLQYADAPVGSGVPYGYTSVPDASITISGVSGPCPALTISATISNIGAATLVIGTPIAVYDANPTTSAATLVGTYVTTAAVAAGATLNVTIPVTLINNTTTVFAVVNDNGTTARPYAFATAFPNSGISECDYTNNMASSAVVCLDSDLDGIANIDDLDDDNDGVLDAVESPTCFYTLLELGKPIAVSTELAPYLTNIITNSIDNSATSYSAFAPTVNWVNKEIFKFTAVDFIGITGISFDLVNWGLSSTAAMTFKMQGSSDDLTWTDLSPAVSSIATTGIFTISNTLAPTSKFKYYRLLGVAGTSYYGGVTNAIFNLASNTVPSGSPKATCSNDTDGDGIVNHLDLDSDNDGCSDAIEAGSSTTATSTSVYPTGTDTNANGLLNAYEGGTAGTINYTSSYSPYAIGNNWAACVDTDADGINDVLDIDDDNDGVLDAVEAASCYMAANDWNTADKTLYATISSQLNTLAPNTDFSALTDNDGAVAAVQFSTAVAQAQLNMELFKVTFSQPVRLDALYIKKTTATQIFAATASSIKLQGSNDNLAWTDLTAAIASPANATNITANGGVSLTNSNKFTVTTNAGNYKYYRVYGVLAANILAGIASEFYFDVNTSTYVASSFPLPSCTVDTDNDGTLNQLDLDSDDDSCSDAVEAGSSTTATSTSAFPTGTDTNANGLLNNYEGATAGTINYTNVYTTYAISSNLASCADTDGDGITNNSDIDDDNDGVLDAAESPTCFYTSNDWYLGPRPEITVTTPLSMAIGQNFPDRLVNGFNAATIFDVRFETTTASINTLGTGREVYRFNMQIPVELSNIYLGYVNTNTHFAAGTNLVLRGSSDGQTWTNLSLPLVYDGTIGAPSATEVTTIPMLPNINNANLFTVTQNAAKYQYYDIYWTTGGGISNAGYANEVYFKTAAGYIPSQHPKISCNTDTDGDGILNHQDLDSDADGCADAKEAGVSGTLTTASTLNNAIAAGPYNANGFANALQTSGNGIYTGTYTYNNARNGAVNGCTDSDNDGVPNISDIDDDNDGVLDLVECPPPGIEPLVPRFDISSGASVTQTISGFPDELYIDIWNIDNNFNLKINNVNITTVSELNFAIGSTYTVPYTNVVQQSGLGLNSPNNVWLYGNTQTRPMMRVVINSFGEVKILGLDGTNGTGNYQELVLLNAAYNVVPINLNGSNTIAFSQNNEYPPTYLNAELNTFEGNGSCDFDNDGIDNTLDLDSDNDGCSDALEARTTSNTTANYQFTGTFGTNGFLDSLETVADNGVYSGLYPYDYAINASVLACLDSDNDGVFDLTDLDDDNDGVLDAIESPTCFYSLTELATPASATSDLNPLLSGGITYGPSNSIDNSTTTYAAYISGQSITDKELYKYTANGLIAISALNLDLFSWPISTNGTSTFKLQGSGDNVLWTDLSAPLASTGTTGTLSISNTLAPTSKFKYFRLLGIAGTCGIGGITNVTFVLATSTRPSGNPKIACSNDTDGDNVLNHLDVDSDNDGCFDVVEAGVLGTSATGIVAGTGNTNYGANGFANALETSTESGNYNDVYFYDYVIEAGLNACLDTDNDGVKDITDIDDDNDGVLDAVESPACFITATEWNTASKSDFIKVSSDLDLLSPNTNLAALVDGIGGTASVQYVSAQSQLNKELLKIEVLVPTQLDAIYIKKTTAANLFSATAATLKVQGSNNNTTWTDLTAAIACPADATNITANGSVSLTNSNKFVLTTNPAAYKYFRIYGVAAGTVLAGIASEIYFDVNTTAYQASLLPKPACSNDTDGDNVVNHLDLDSDGDGCNDAKEAGTTTNTTANYTHLGPYGANGLANSLEALADNGIYNGTYTYNYAISTAINACIDTDSDGVPNSLDIDDDNDGVTDSEECGVCPGVGGTAQLVAPSAVTTVPVNTFGISAWGSVGIYAADGSGLSAIPTTEASLATITHSSPTLITNAAYTSDAQDITNDWLFSLAAPTDVKGVVLWTPGSSPYGGGDAPMKKVNFVWTDCNNVQFSKQIELGLPSPNAKIFYFDQPINALTSIKMDILEVWYDQEMDQGVSNGWEIATPGTINSAFNVTLGEIRFITQIGASSVVCTTDTDNDGIPNQLDLDSDGDGCSDAIESGSSTTATSTTVYPTGTDSNGNGLNNNYEGPTAGTINYSSVYNQFAISSTANACADADGDGISNSIDIDDDNDGVLDFTEAPSCYYNAAQLANPIAVSTELAPYLTNTIGLSIDGNATTYSAFAPSVNWVGKELFNFTATDYIAISGMSFDLVNWALSSAATNTFKLQGFSTNGTWTDLSVAVASTATTGTFTINNTLAPSTKFKYYRLVGVAGTSFYGGVYTARFDFPTTFDPSLYPQPGICAVDTDNDGIPNQLDLDSDNDGCSDAIEASSSTTATSTTVYQTGTDANSNGLLNNYESATAGTINYTSTYSNYALSATLNACLDTDSDGIKDLTDIDDDNDGVLDAIESPTCFYTALELGKPTAVSTELAPYTTNVIANSIDNSPTTFSAFAPTVNWVNKEIFKFTAVDFIGITGISFDLINWPLSSTAAMTFKLQGSSNESSWTDLSPAVASTTGTGTFTISNTLATSSKFKYYRLLGVSGTSYYGGVTNALFNLATNTIPSGSPKATCSNDTDGDGKVNHLDLDSDGDGCSDAIEAGSSTTATSTSAYPTGADANANGLLNNYEGGIAGTINYTSSYGLALSNNVNACTDTDNDGIKDIFDIDDDNDGVTDIIELSCTPVPIPNGTCTPAQWGAATYGIFTHCSGWNAFDFDPSPAIVDRSDFDYMGLTGTDPYFDLQGSYTTPLFGKIYKIFTTIPGMTYTFDVTLMSVFTDALNGSKPYIKAIDNSNGIILGSGYMNGTGYRTITFIATSTSTMITFGHDSRVDFSGNQFWRGGNLVQNGGPSQECVLLDSDNDGIPNHLDTDSDGDGCSDAKEAGTTTSTTANYTHSGPYGANGFANALETVADNGIYNGTYVYNYAIDATQNLCIDTDGDGIGDLIDLDDDNDGVLDVTELACAEQITSKVGVIVTKPATINYTFNSNTLANLVDGVDANIYVIGAPTGTLTNSPLLNFEFPTPIALSYLEIGHYQNQLLFATTSTYKIQGSTNNTTWTDVTGTLTYNNVATSTSGGLSTYNSNIANFPTNTNAYKYYRVFGINAATGGGWATEVYFKQNNCSWDIDNDGIVNSLDLDSDGDGCSDAIEASSSTTATSTTVYPTGTDTNTNGLLNNYEGTTAGTINYTSTYSNYALSATLNACLDTDSDGIKDLTDIDDDNDGVLDNQECSCVASLLPKTGIVVSSPATWSYANGATSLQALVDGVDALIFVANTTATFTNAPILQFDLPSAKVLTQIELGNYPGQTPLVVNGTFKMQGWDGTQWGDIGINQVIANTAPINATNNSIKFNMVNNLIAFSKYRIFGVAAAGSGVWAQEAYFTQKTCNDIDTDSDGIPNRLDLDSDGDACADAIEASSSTTATNTATYPTGADANTNGLNDNYELSTLGGSYNYTSTYEDYALSNTINACLDTDSDGITDFIDIDDDNDGVLDAAEMTACATMWTPTAVTSSPFYGSSSANLTINNSGLNGSGLTATVDVPNTLTDTWYLLEPNTTGFLEYTLPANTTVGGVVLWAPDATNYGGGDGPVKDFKVEVIYNNVITYTSPTYTTAQPIGAGSNGGAQVFYLPKSFVNPQKIRLIITSGWYDVNNNNSIQVGTETIAPGTVNGAYNMTLSEFKVICAPVDIDTDGDGIPNRLDLDSDGDACADAIEAGGSITATSTSAYPSGTDANSNGLLNNYEGATSGTISYTSTYTDYALINTINMCTDTDGDGVPDFNDLDNDNDGVLDAVESPSCFLSATEWNTANKSYFAKFSSQLSQSATNNFAALGDGNGTTAAVQIQASQDQNNKELFKIEMMKPTQLDAIYIKKTTATQIFAATVASIKVQGSNDNLAWTDLTAAIAAPADATNTTVSGAVVLTNSNKFTLTTNPGAYKYFRIYGIVSANTLGGIASEFYFDVNTATYNASRYPKATCISDSDGDGVVNHLDLDSDNDGCSDANEAYNSSTAQGTDGNMYYGTGNPPATNANGSVTAATYPGTNANVLTVGTASTITSQPANQSVTAGTTATFTATVTPGSGTTTYQWQVSTNSGATWTNVTNSSTYTGATTTTLSVANTTLAMSGYQYHLLISQSNYICGNIASNAATLTIGGLIQIVNDNASTLEDTPLNGSVTLNDIGSGGSSVTINTFTINGTTYNAGQTAVIAGVGTIVINSDGTYTFTPAPNFNGNVPSISYSATDGNASTGNGLLAIVVTAVNDAPIVDNEVVTTNEDAPATGDLTDAGDSDPDGTALTANTTPVSGPSNGTIVINADGTYTYTPNPNFNGTDVIVVSICDAGLPLPGVCVNDTITVTVAPVNDAPIVDNEVVTTNEDTPATGDLTDLGDSDPDGTPLTANTTPVSGPTNGTIVINPDGTYTYTPNPGFSGTDVIVVSICDAGTPGVTCVNDTINITVSPVNDAPIVDNEVVTTNEDAPVTGDLTDAGDSDPDGTALTANTTPVSGPSNGTIVINTDGTYTYTPNPNFNGTDVIVVSICDAGLPLPGVCVNDTITVTVAPVNDAPIVDNEVVTTNEDTPATGDLTDAGDSDPDGTSLTVNTTPVSGPTNGTIVINPDGTYTYTPNPGFSGTDVIVVSVCDAGTPGVICINDTINITVNAVNDAPIAVDNINVVTPEDVPVTGNVLTNDSDPDGDAITVSQFTIAGVPGIFTAGTTATIPGVGTIVINANGSYTFTPNANYNGPVPAITYTASDSNGGTDTATLGITVSPVNDAPIAIDDVVTATEDTPVTGNVLINDTDADGNTLTVSQITVNGITYPAGTTATIPGVGAIVVNANGTYTFTPALDYTGNVPDIFYTVVDGNGGSDTGLLDIIVNAVNDAPLATDDIVVTPEDVPVSGNVLTNDTDLEGDPLSVTQFTIAGVAGTFTAGQTATIPGVGNIVVNANGTYTFTPVLNYTGTVPDITYTVTDGTSTDTAVISIFVAPVNDEPVANNDANTVLEDNPATGNVLTNDTDTDTPLANLEVTQITFTVGGTTYTYPSGSMVTIPGVGTIIVNTNGTYTFTPNNNWNGTVPVITYVVSDGEGGVDSGTLTLTVTAVNDGPITVNDDNIVTPENTPVSGNVLTNDSDPEGNPLTVSQFTIAGVSGTFTAGTTATIPGVGTIVINANGSYTFTPNTNYNGPVPVISYTAVDSNGGSGTANLGITVSDVNVAPIAVDDAISAPEDTPINGNVLTNDTDADGNTLAVADFTVNGVTYPVGTTANIPNVGTIVVNVNGTFTFTPVPNYTGTVPTITYIVGDGNGGTDNGALVLTVSPVNDAPIIDNEVVVTNEDTPLTGDLTDAGDSDPDGTPLTVNTTPVSGPTNGTIVINPDGTYTYTPNPGFSGTDVIVVSVCDAGLPLPGVCVNDTITVTVSPVNDAPIVDNEVVVTNEDVPATGDLTDAGDSDPDGTALTANTTPVSGPSNGTIVINPDGTYTYTPNPNFNGVDTIIVSVCDAGLPLPGVCVNDTITVTVSPVNDAPIVDNEVVTTNEDTPLTGDLTDAGDSDPDGTPLTVNTTPVSGPTNGTIVINPDGTYTYTPNPGFSGTDVIVVSICDAGLPLPGVCVNDTITVTVSPVNDAPIVDNEVVTTNEDTPATGDLTDAGDSDPDGTPLTANTTPVSGPTNGTIVINPDGTYTYTPNPNFNGTDVVVVSICDAGTPGVICINDTINITVTAVNDAPIVDNEVVTTNENTPATGDLTDAGDSDPDGTPLTVNTTPVSGPTNGTIVINPNGTYTYTPNPGFSGTDVIVVSICDAGLPLPGVCVNDTITVTVLPVTETNPDMNVTSLNIPVSGNLVTNDDVPVGTTYGVPTGNPSNPAGGTIAMNPDGTYTFTGTNTGVYTYNVPVCAPGQTTNCPTEELIITVLDPNSTTNNPINNTDLATSTTTTPVVINGLSNDASGNTGGSLNPGSLTITDAPNHGTATVNPSTGAVTYTANAGFVGTDTLVYQVCDNSSPTPLCGTAMQIITILPANGVNDGPAASDDYMSEEGTTPATGNVLINDTDPEGNTLNVTPQTTTIPGKGTLVLNTDGTYTFTPVPGFTGTVDIPYTACDNGIPQVCTQATLYITYRVSNTPLYVNLFSFKAKSNACDIDLVWEAKNEVNFSRYEVLRKVEGSSDFVKIAEINSKATDDKLVTYNYRDKDLLSNKRYEYKLKMVDMDSKYSFSKTEWIKLDCSPKEEIFVYPNPIRGNELYIDLYNKIGTDYKFILVDMTGRKILESSKTLNNERETVTLSTHHIAAGVYHLLVETPQSSAISYKIIKE